MRKDSSLKRTMKTYSITNSCEGRQCADKKYLYAHTCTCSFSTYILKRSFTKLRSFVRSSVRKGIILHSFLLNNIYIFKTTQPYHEKSCSMRPRKAHISLYARPVLHVSVFSVYAEELKFVSKLIHNIWLPSKSCGERNPIG